MILPRCTTTMPRVCCGRRSPASLKAQSSVISSAAPSTFGNVALASRSPMGQSCDAGSGSAVRTGTGSKNPFPPEGRKRGDVLRDDGRGVPLVIAPDHPEPRAQVVGVEPEGVPRPQTVGQGG